MTSYYDSPSQLRRQKEATVSELQELLERINRTKMEYKRAVTSGDESTAKKLRRELDAMSADLPSEGEEFVQVTNELSMRQHSSEPGGLTVTTRHGERSFW